MNQKIDQYCFHRKDYSEWNKSLSVMHNKNPSPIVPMTGFELTYSLVYWQAASAYLLTQELIETESQKCCTDNMPTWKRVILPGWDAMCEIGAVRYQNMISELAHRNYIFKKIFIIFWLNCADETWTSLLTFISIFAWWKSNVLKVLYRHWKG